MGHFPDAEYAPVYLGGSRYLPLLSQVHILDNWGKVIRAPRLDLDKTDRLSVDGNYVDLPRDLDALAVAAHWYLEVSDDQPITGPGEEISGELLTALAKGDRSYRLGIVRRC